MNTSFFFFFSFSSSSSPPPPPPPPPPPSPSPPPPPSSSSCHLFIYLFIYFGTFQEEISPVGEHPSRMRPAGLGPSRRKSAENIRHTLPLARTLVLHVTWKSLWGPLLSSCLSSQGLVVHTIIPVHSGGGRISTSSVTH
jgi:hypothetical protein